MAERATVARVLRLVNIVERATPVRALQNSEDPNEMSEGGLDPGRYSYDTIGVDGPDLAKEAMAEWATNLAPPGDSREWINGGGSISNGDSSLAN